MVKNTTTPWIAIKSEYLQGVTPKELAKKYNVTPKQVRDKASRGNWAEEKSTICDKTRQNVEDKIESLISQALDALENVLNDENAPNRDKIAAAKAILDISGLKSSKQEIIGKGDAPLTIGGFATMEDAVKHFKEMIGEC